MSLYCMLWGQFWILEVLLRYHISHYKKYLSSERAKLMLILNTHSRCLYREADERIMSNGAHIPVCLRISPHFFLAVMFQCVSNGRISSSPLGIFIAQFASKVVTKLYFDVSFPN